LFYVKHGREGCQHGVLRVFAREESLIAGWQPGWQPAAGIIIVPQIRIDSALTRWSWITGKLDHGRLISR
jgi:hypothetical protein